MKKNLKNIRQMTTLDVSQGIGYRLTYQAKIASQPLDFLQQFPMVFRRYLLQIPIWDKR